MKKFIVLPGDGVGPEVIAEVLKALKAVEKKFGIKFQIETGLIGGASIDKYGVPITDMTMSLCKKIKIVLLGAIGGQKWDNLPLDKRPEKGLLALRKALGVYTNLRPVKVYAELIDSLPVKRETAEYVDMLIVRELTGGLYFGKPKSIKPCRRGERAIDTMVYRTSEIERVAIAAFKAASLRRKKVTSVDKANVLATSQLWRKTVTEVAKSYPDITVDHMLVDNCAMQLIRAPKQFDVVLTENTFGDILSDEASVLSGSLGMSPSASLGKKTALYEPVHGSAPDIAGEGKANPIGAILSAAMMLRYSFSQEQAARTIETAVTRVLQYGIRTPDIASNGGKIVSTEIMGNKIAEEILKQ